MSDQGVQATHVFNLPSGPECEVKPLTGAEQRILTENTKESFRVKMGKILASRVVRIGSKTDLDAAFFETVLTGDRKAILGVLRQFSFGFPEVYELFYDYTDTNKRKRVHKEIIPLENGKFPVHPMHVMQEVEKDGEMVRELVPSTFTEYEEVLKHIKVRFNLPSGLEVEFTMLDNTGDIIGENTKKANVSSHSPLQMRRPVYFEMKEKSKIPITVNLDKLSFMDINELRRKIREVEPRVDSECTFEAPEGMDTDSPSILVDVMQRLDFFFPGGVM